MPSNRYQIDATYRATVINRSRQRYETDVVFRERKKEKSRERYQQDAGYREKVKARSIAQHAVRKLAPGYRESNNEKQRLRYQRKKNDPAFSIPRNMRIRICRALKGKTKTARTLELLGCTIEFLRKHLEKQFQPGMSWENYGPVWHVDHILPCAEFHLQHSEEQEICFHWTNLQPLFATENQYKHSKILCL